MNKFGLPQRAMDEMHAIFAKHGKVKKVVLYGSRAMGNYKNGSDIDLTMYGSALTFDDLNNIAGELEESSIPYLVDLSIFDVLDHAKLKDHIKRHGRVFYDRYAEWKTVKLDEIVTLSMGKTPSRSNAKFWDKEKITNNIWLSIADLTALNGWYIEDSKEYVSDEGAKLFKAIPPDTLVMSFKLSIGKLGITKCGLRTNEAIAALPIKDEKIITKEYLLYFLSSLDWNVIAGNDVKVKGKTLNKAKLKEILITLPPLAEQQRIVAKLDATFAEIDTAIAATNAKEAEIEKLKSALLGASLSGDAETWQTVRLGDICRFVRGPFGGSLKKSYFVETGYAVYEQQHAIKNQCENFRYFVTQEKFDEMSRFAVSVGDILMSCSGTIGKTTIVPKGMPKGIINQALLKITPHEALHVRFLKFYMESKLFAEQLINTVDGAAIQNVASVKILKDITINLPPLAEQQRIVAELDAAFAEIDTAKSAISKSQQNYNALKSSILAQELQSEAA